MKYRHSKKSSASGIMGQFSNFPVLFLILFAFAMLHSSFVVADDDENKDKIKIKKVLQNTFYDDCHYSGEVVLEVKYKLKSQEINNIVLEGSLDSVDYFQILTKEVEKGKGRSNLVFDAGDCLQAVRVSFEF